MMKAKPLSQIQQEHPDEAEVPSPSRFSAASATSCSVRSIHHTTLVGGNPSVPEHPCAGHGKAGQEQQTGIASRLVQSVSGA
jgi:hypothetical protein